MKLQRLSIIILLLAFSGIIVAQTPSAFKYQAVIRDIDGIPITNTEIGIQIEIYNSDFTNDAYIENHLVVTNGFGLINIEVGNGEEVQGKFEGIRWGHLDHFLKVSIDAEGGLSNFSIIGTSQILSVPMATYAAVAGNVVDTSITNEIQHLNLNYDDILSLSLDGGEIDLSIFNDSQAIADLNERITTDSLFFDGELDLLSQQIIDEVARATLSESALADMINQNANEILENATQIVLNSDFISENSFLINNNTTQINDNSVLIGLNDYQINHNSSSLIQTNTRIYNDSVHFQDLIDNFSGNNGDSLYFAELINDNTQRIITDSAFLKSLIDQNTQSIQQEITRAILSESINAGNIAINTQGIANIEISRINDSTYFQSLINQNTTAINAEITRAIMVELTNAAAIAANTQNISLNTQEISNISISFQTQINQIDLALQEEITRATYRDQVNTDSIQINASKLLADSLHFQAQIDGLSNGSLDPSLENGKIFVGNAAGEATGVNLSGDAQMTNTGTLIINPNAITTAKVADGNISNAKLTNSTFTITDSQGNSGDIALGSQLKFKANGSTLINFDEATNTMNISSTDNQLLSVNGNNLSISSGNVVDLSGLSGNDGQDGVGIESTVDNNDGTFTLNYTDGSSFTTTNFIGEKGDKGDQGDKGEQGDIGLTGAQGAQGIQGIKGDKGDEGDQGNIGLTGPQGTQGIQGIKGDKGDKGDQGNIGLTGSQGTQGIQGIKGDKGDKGDTGSIGLTGPQGSQGPVGAQGAIGPAGATGLIGLTGAQGIQGTQGISINWLGDLFIAPGSPSLNDGYHDKIMNISYIWDGSLWKIITKDGAQGPTGATGPAGTSISDCPAGGWSPVNEQFCIQINESSATTWWNASKACGDVNASLCTWDEWYYTCQTGSGTLNMTNDWEWTDAGQAGGTPTATTVGNAGCTNSQTANMTDTKTYRCCFSR